MTLSSKICRALGGTPPEGFNYELFLDDKGEKISKSRGNGLTIDEWLRYASPESLSLFMFQKPKSAKRLYFDVIPRAVDEYLQLLAAYPRQDAKAQLDNAVWHVHGGAPPETKLPVSFALLLNLVAASNAHDKDVLWGFIRRHCAGCEPRDLSAARSARRLRGALLRGLRASGETATGRPTRSSGALLRRSPRRWHAHARTRRRRSCKPSSTTWGARSRAIRTPRQRARRRTSPASQTLGSMPSTRCCLGESKGPRFGSFIELYGIAETRALIDKALKGELVEAA